MKKLVLNIPDHETENLFLDAVLLPCVELSSRGCFTMIYGEQDQLLELTSLPGSFLINATSFASDIPEAFDREGNPYDIFITYNEDESRPNDEVLVRVDNFFRTNGCQSFNVGINPPFIKNIAGTTVCSSFTMALNRSLYMHEKERKIILSSYKLKTFFNDLYFYILASIKNCGGRQ